MILCILFDCSSVFHFFLLLSRTCSFLLFYLSCSGCYQGLLSSKTRTLFLNLLYQQRFNYKPTFSALMMQYGPAKIKMKIFECNDRKELKNKILINLFLCYVFSIDEHIRTFSRNVDKII